jgi:hypothetical protein
MVVQIFWGSDNLGKYQKYVVMNKDKLKSNWKLYTHSEILELLSNKYNFLNDPEFTKQNVIYQSNLIRLILIKELGGCYLDLDVKFLVDTIQLEEELNIVYNNNDVFIYNGYDDVTPSVKYIDLTFFKATQNSQGITYLSNFYLERKYSLSSDVDMVREEHFPEFTKLNCKLIPEKYTCYLFKHLGETHK